MSIVLKTDLVGGFNATEMADLVHDCKAAHAMRISIEEAQAANLSRLSDDGIRAWLTCVKCIRDNAAANLARLMGEGNG